MHIKSAQAIVSFGLFFLLTTNVFSANLFSVQIGVYGSDGYQTEYSQSYRTIEDIFNAIDSTPSIQNIAPNYTNTSAVNITLNIRGIGTEISYDENGTDLSLSIPALDRRGVIYQTIFYGSNRDESEQALEDYLKANGDSLLTQILGLLVAETGTDPVAGNPNSLMARMGTSDFTMGTGEGTSGKQNSEEQGSTGNIASFGLRSNVSSIDGFNQETYTLPLRYTVRLDSDPRKQIIIDAPITYFNIEGSKGYDLSFGIGYRHPLTDDWYITPAVRYGALGSIDVGSAAMLYSGSITSNYTMYWDDFTFSLGNMVGYYKTVSLDADEYEFDYDLQNTMFKNGIAVDGPLGFTILGKPSTWKFDVAYTFFTGDELYIDQYADFALSIGTREEDNFFGHARLGLTYTTGSHGYNSYGINFGYQF